MGGIPNTALPPCIACRKLSPSDHPTISLPIFSKVETALLAQQLYRSQSGIEEGDDYEYGYCEWG
ncbi:hypothetical protein [Moorena sp. SIO3I6]|uniref:hypothetical protein n=1 Tax=Moorena sp. SIO3I6 TaxID=2607831 RepID=UPI0013CD7F0D|nr:hypothetical protein [Moorena sp. SIO3I6]NEO23888.1 hypothetical protein [Moorena sp. SIO4A5]NEP25795.1 hypothetical protein [Moorena sp. SIO3I6]